MGLSLSVIDLDGFGAGAVDSAAMDAALDALEGLKQKPSPTNTNQIETAETVDSVTSDPSDTLLTYTNYPDGYPTTDPNAEAEADGSYVQPWAVGGGRRRGGHTHTHPHAHTHTRTHTHTHTHTHSLTHTHTGRRVPRWGSQGLYPWR